MASPPHPPLPGARASFTSWFRTVTAGLATDRGWYSVFLRRDPQQMRDFVAGDDVPPWDIVASLLQDLAGGGDLDARVAEDARRLHRTAVEEHDLGAGRQAVVTALETTLRERDRARQRLADLASTGTGAHQQAARQTPWLQDLHERLAARCVELRHRLVTLDNAVPEQPAEQVFVTPAGPEPTQPMRGAPRTRTERLGSTFASMTLGLQGVLPSPALVGSTPTVPEEQEQEEEDPAQLASDWRTVHHIAWQLAMLRANGAGGEAHVLLCETVMGPARRLPRLARALEETSQFPEVGVLVWETASLPPEAVATAVQEFAGQDRAGDVEALLRHASARPPADIARLASSLARTGRRAEAVLLLGHVVRTRPRESAVDLARMDATLVPLLVRSARDISEWHYMQLDYALRIAGMARGPQGAR